jgi:serine/threonine protein kinase
VALKYIKIPQSQEGLPTTALREISVLRELDHPAVIQLLDVIHTGHNNEELVMVFEYLKTDLRKYLLQEKHFLSIKRVKSFLRQIL